MNHLSTLFRTLFEAWNADAASDDVDRLAAELTAQVAAELYQHGVRHCSLMLVETDQVSRYQGLNLFLQSYGLRLGLKVLKSGKGCILGIASIPRRQKASGRRAEISARQLEVVME